MPMAAIRGLGAGDWMVVEADESDGSFLRLPAVITIVTNMDPEHLDHWGTREAMEAGYRQFVAQYSVLRLRGAVHRPSGGAADDPRTFGSSRDYLWIFAAGGYARRSGSCPAKDGATFEVRFADRATGRARRMGPFKLPMLGNHNVSERAGGDCGCDRNGDRRGADQSGACRVCRREAALLPRPARRAGLP